MEIIIKSPQNCTQTELETFASLVLEGGEVDSAGLQERILHTEKLFFIHENDCVAVGAIKNPYPRYKSDVFKKSNSPEAGKYRYELGWLYVANAAREKGYGRVLMEAITHSLTNSTSFATTREDNKPMHHLLTQFGFTKLGQPYKSANGDYSLVLYAKL